MNTNEIGNNPINVNPVIVIHNNEQVRVNLVIRQAGINLPRNQILHTGQNHIIQWIQQPVNPQNAILTVQRQIMPN
jgi:hypothetical protein